MGEGAEADESGSESEEGLMDVIEAFISDTQSRVIVNPREEAFHHPSASSKAAAVQCAPLGQQRRDAVLDAVLSEPLSMRFAVIAPVAQQLTASWGVGADALFCLEPGQWLRLRA